MATIDTSSDGQPTRAFYLPATLVRTPARVARSVAGRLAARGHAVRAPTDTPPARWFYTPATAVRSTVPGRLERAVASALRNRDGRGRVAAVGERVREFTIPVTVRASPPTEPATSSGLRAAIRRRFGR